MKVPAPTGKAGHAVSVMKTTPVFKCRYAGCGRTVVVTSLQTTRPDPSTKLLEVFMANLSKVALCPWHTRQRAWYCQQGRDEEWEAMAAGRGLLIAVRDPMKEWKEKEVEDAEREARG